jgi:putative oxidoreductase
MLKNLKKTAQWTPTVLLALPMIVFGSAKLAGVPDVLASFATMGLPGWFGYAVGCAEVLGGIGLLIPRLSALAATALIPIMLGALYFHITYEVPSAAPAMVFILLAAYTIFSRKNQAIGYPRQALI